jgi:hypothetical protein
VVQALVHVATDRLPPYPNARAGDWNGLQSFVDRLDDLVTGWCDPAAVALVWSDTQGSETDVISAGGELWATTPMWVEFWPAGLEVHGGTARFLELVVDRFSHFAVSGDLDAVSPVDALTAAMADRRHVNLLLLP